MHHWASGTGLGCAKPCAAASAFDTPAVPSQVLFNGNFSAHPSTQDPVAQSLSVRPDGGCGRKEEPRGYGLLPFYRRLLNRQKVFIFGRYSPVVQRTFVEK
jgi:hypothetical protein